MVNYNPETVSTDYDECDKLIFDEVTLSQYWRSTSASSPTASWCRWRTAAEQSGHSPAPRRGAHPRHQRRIHRYRRGPAQVQRPARPVGHRPAALGARRSRLRGRAHCGAIGRLSGAGAPQLRALRCGHERGAREERARASSPAPAVSPSTRWWSPSSRPARAGDRRRGRRRRDRALGDQRARGGRGRPLRRCSCSAAIAQHRNHPQGAQDRPGAGQGAGDHRPLQCAVSGQAQ